MPALDGMRVFDLTQYEAGTSCTQWLGWLGADVVKIERPGKGEAGRSLGPGPGDSGYFIYWNSNKRSVALDIRSEAGRELLLRMLPHYDVFAENFAPGAMEKLGLDYATLEKIHPGIIYARVKGFGSDGPYSGYKSFDMVAQAAGGAFSVNGETAGPPLKPGPTLADAGSGLQLALAILAAYVQRLRDGVGQLVEVSMQEAVTYFLRTTIGSMSNWGQDVAPRLGNTMGPTMNIYPCAPGGPNDYIYVMAVQPHMQEALFNAIGRSELFEQLDPGVSFAGPVDAPNLSEEIASWTRGRTKHEAMRLLGEAGVPCSAVLDTHDLFEDPHLRSRGFIEKIQHPEQGELPILGAPIRLSKCPIEMRPAPLLGKHTAEVLRSDLGLSDSELAGLREQGAID